MANDDYIETEGIVLEALRDGKFLIDIEEFKKQMICHLSGKIRKNSIKILKGDKVVVKVSVFDPDKGRIVFRKK
jgi:translation initiation factor IF-1